MTRARRGVTRRSSGALAAILASLWMPPAQAEEDAPRERSVADTELSSPPAAGRGDAAIDARIGVPVRFDPPPYPPPLERVQGVALDLVDQEEAAELIAIYASTYPDGFLARYVRDIIVLDDLVVDGVLARGHRNERSVLLEFRGPRGHRLAKRDFDHEVFHALDGYLAEVPLDRRWESERARAVRLRNLWDDYRLTPSHRYTFSWQLLGTRLPWMAYVPVVGLFWIVPRLAKEAPPGFAYSYGVVTPREDRATVAEALLAGDERFLRRAAADEELREKVAIVKAMYLAGSSGALDEAFWEGLAPGQASVPSLADLEKRLWPTPIPARVAGGVPEPGRELRAGGQDGEPGSHEDAEREVPEEALERPPVVAVLPPRDRGRGEITVSSGRDAEVGTEARAPLLREPAGSGEPGRRAGRGEGTALPAAARTRPSERPPPRPGETPAGAARAPGDSPRPAAQPRAEATPAAPSGTAAAYAEGLAAFRAGDPARAGSLWRAMLSTVSPDYATIQISINCVFENLAKNHKALDGAASFYMLSTSYRGKECALSLTGLYKTRDDAAIALAGLPASIREQHPRVVSVGEALRSSR